MVIALLTAVTAWYRSRTHAGNYYADQVYGMDRRIHTRYALTGAILFVLLGASLFYQKIPSVLLLGIAVIVAVFYFSSFARGFSDEE